MRLLYLSSAWLGGIYLGSLFELRWLYPLLIFITMAVGMVFFLNRRPGWLLLMLSLGLFLAGIFRQPSEGSENLLRAYFNETVQLRGEIITFPRTYKGSQEFILKVKEVVGEEGGVPVKGKVLVVVPLLPEYSYGDVLTLRGRLKAPEGKGLSGVMVYPVAEAVGRGGGILRPVYLLRHKLSRALERYLGEPQGTLARALLLGIREDLPKTLKKSFSRSGTAHLLAISGLHISILLGILLSFGAWALGRHRPYYLIVAFLGMWLYAMLSGLRPPAFRASIMGSLLLAGEYLGRPGAPVAALAFAAALMVGLDPSLLWDISFQLSFLAMAGLVFLSPQLKTWLSAVRPRYLCDGLAYTLGAIIATFPLVAYYFHILSLVSLPATLMALPVLPGIILMSAAVAFFGLFIPPLAYPFAWLDWLLLSYLIVIVKGLASLPGAFLEVKPFPAAWLWLYYAGMGLGLWALNRKALFSRLWTKLSPVLLSSKFAFGLLPVALLVWAIYLALPDPRLSIVFFDVGNGDAILIQKGLCQILIDGGPDPDRLLSGLSREMPFFDRSIELVVLTHPDADHLRGLLEVLRRYKVKQIAEPEWPSSTLLYREWRRLIEGKKVSLVKARAGQRFLLGEEATFEILHPQNTWLEGSDEDEDNNSVVSRLDVGEYSFLFTGDLRGLGERELLMLRAHLRADVLKVAHHGSATSTSEAFLSVVRPRVAVISAAGWGGLPHENVISRLQKFVGPNLLITAERGSIKLLTDGHRLWLKTEK